MDLFTWGKTRENAGEGGAEVRRQKCRRRMAEFVTTHSSELLVEWQAVS